MIFGRVKPLDAILATAQKKSLQRSLGWFQLTMLGIGCVIGTGIFVLTSAAAQKAGPGMMISFIIAGAVCVVAALCYAEIAAMVPVAGSAYTYTYSVMGEFLAWTVGWALVLEYAVAASAVAVGWSGYFTGSILNNTLGIHLPIWLAVGPQEGGFINLPAVVISLLVTWLLMIGTSESARVNAILVTIKVAALTAFVALTLPKMHGGNFDPFLPAGFFRTGGVGVMGAAATIFFAYVGFDAVSTAAEETRDPQRNVPIGLIASLGFCTVFYMLVAAGAIGTIGGQPIMGASGNPLETGSAELAQRCAAIAATGAAQPLVCSKEALAQVLREIGYANVGNWMGYAAGLALPSVILILLFGQTRIFFVMSRDGLLPDVLSRVHPKWKTPHVVTAITGLAVAFCAAFLPVGELADYANAGTLYAFGMVAAALLILRKTDPKRHRPFKTPAAWIIAPLTIVGCAYLYISLPLKAILVLPIWGVIGLFIYFGYSYRHSHLGRGIVEVHDLDENGLEPDVPATD
jgi:APA family basic amino acid/polyamine antiporter